MVNMLAITATGAAMETTIEKEKCTSSSNRPARPTDGQQHSHRDIISNGLRVELPAVIVVVSPLTPS